MRRPEGLPWWAWSASLPGCLGGTVAVLLLSFPFLRSLTADDRPELPTWALVAWGACLVLCLVAAVGGAVYLLRHPHLRSDRFVKPRLPDEGRPR